MKEILERLFSKIVCFKKCIIDNMLIFPKIVLYLKLVYMHLQLYMDYFYDGVLLIICKMKILMNI